MIKEKSRKRTGPSPAFLAALRVVRTTDIKKD